MVIPTFEFLGNEELNLLFKQQDLVEAPLITEVDYTQYLEKVLGKENFYRCDKGILLAGKRDHKFMVYEYDLRIFRIENPRSKEDILAEYEYHGLRIPDIYTMTSFRQKHGISDGVFLFGPFNHKCTGGYLLWNPPAFPCLYRDPLLGYAMIWKYLPLTNIPMYCLGEKSIISVLTTQ